MMKSEKFFVFLFILWAIFGSSLQDGFNLYKAFNRTPISRMERFYRDGLPSRYKVPVTKRLLYDGLKEQEDNKKTSEDFISMLLNWNADIKANQALKRKEDKCLEIQNVMPNVD